MSNLDANGNPTCARLDGWYMVRRNLGGNLGLNGWECARWSLAARCWYSVDWFGLPDTHVVCGARIELPPNV